MSAKQRKHFQHVWAQANKRGLNLGNLKTNKVDGERARQKLNSVVDWIEHNAQSVESAENLAYGVKVPTTTAKWLNPDDGRTYWVTRVTSSNEVLGLGSK
jgi:hypothetical protein